MIPYLLEKFIPHFSGLNALSYITSRAILALLFSFVLSLILFPPFIRLLKQKKIGQQVRDDGPKSHAPKHGTPTMGGIVLVLVSLSMALLWMKWENPYIWIVIGHTVGFGLLGLADDLTKFTRSHTLGLRGSIKLILSGCILALDVYALQGVGMNFYISFPFFKDFYIYTPFVVIPFIFVVILGTANAANLTDGLDGLLAGILLIVLSTIGILC